MIAVSENDTLYCLNGLNDTPVWKFVADPCYLERGLIALPDLDGDTIADVVLGTIWGTRKVFAISGSDGSVIWQYDTHEYGSGGWIYEASPMVDMDGDSVIDILASAGGDADRAYLFSGATGIKIWEDSIGYAGYGIREIGDINGDSIPDVAVATGNTVPSANMVKFLDGENGNLIRDATLTATVGPQCRSVIYLVIRYRMLPVARVMVILLQSPAPMVVQYGQPVLAGRSWILISCLISMLMAILNYFLQERS